ncbi:MAG: hypothetical protein JO181_07775 [Solirubrobacterales bacterium]|nr:hypothetical protein [Solirubrobacterales bacterium]MBV9797408.1 hypothetical protein [Solirubrobacterales bacterium]
MPFIRKHFKLLTVAASCVVIGAGISAITSAGAATPSTRTNATTRAHGRLAGLRALKRAVHGQLVIPTKNGFTTITFDRGTIASVNGRQLSINDGTKKRAYSSVTLSIPVDARIRDNGQRAAMSDLKVGQRVLVIQGPKRWLVVAHTPRTA